jgi:hypothetical protein
MKDPLPARRVFSYGSYTVRSSNQSKLEDRMTARTERRFDQETVREWLRETCEKNHFVLPCEIDSWY